MCQADLFHGVRRGHQGTALTDRALSGLDVPQGCLEHYASRGSSHSSGQERFPSSVPRSPEMQVRVPAVRTAGAPSRTHPRERPPQRGGNPIRLRLRSRYSPSTRPDPHPRPARLSPPEMTARAQTALTLGVPRLPADQSHWGRDIHRPNTPRV